MAEEMNEFIKDAENKVIEAEKHLKKRCFPISLFVNSDPARAADLYQEAADLYLTINNYYLSAKCYEKSAEICKTINDLGSKSQAAQCYMKAGDVYGLKDFFTPEKAIECYNSSALYYALSGNFSIAASRRISAANISLQIYDYKSAEASFKTAIEYYEKAIMPSSAMLLYDKYIMTLLKNENYKIAGDKFLILGKARANKELYMLCSYICYYICNDPESMENIYLSIASSEEKTIIDSFYSDDEDKNSFTEKIDKYLAINPVNDEIRELIEQAKHRTRPEFDIL